MAIFASWAHGNALTVENPESLAEIRHMGWGTDMRVRPGQGSWFHIPVPTPVIVNDVRAKLARVFVMFDSEPGQGRIRNVHVFDGPNRIAEFNDLSLSGHHSGGLDGSNQFDLPTPHEVLWGIGVTFFFQAAVGIDSAIPPPPLLVASGGGDFIV
jgi:hypothetical protein